MGHLGDLSAFSQKFLKNSSNFFPLGVLGVTFPFVQKALGQHKALPLVKKSQKKFLPKMRFFWGPYTFWGVLCKNFPKIFWKIFWLSPNCADQNRVYFILLSCLLSVSVCLSLKFARTRRDLEKFQKMSKKNFQK